MRGYFRHVSPGGAVGDLIGQLRERRRHRWVFLALAATATMGIFSLIVQEKYVGLPKPPDVIYFPSLLPNRTDAQIRAENIEATRKGREEAAREAAEDEAIRGRYKAVGDVFGMDTKRAMTQGDIERAEAQRKLDAQNAEILRKHLVK